MPGAELLLGSPPSLGPRHRSAPANGGKFNGKTPSNGSGQAVFAVRWQPDGEEKIDWRVPAGDRLPWLNLSCENHVLGLSAGASPFKSFYTSLADALGAAFMHLRECDEQGKKCDVNRGHLIFVDLRECARVDLAAECSGSCGVSANALRRSFTEKDGQVQDQLSVHAVKCAKALKESESVGEIVVRKGYGRPMELHRTTVGAVLDTLLKPTFFDDVIPPLVAGATDPESFRCSLHDMVEGVKGRPSANGLLFRPSKSNMMYDDEDRRISCVVRDVSVYLRHVGAELGFGHALHAIREETRSECSTTGSGVESYESS